MSAVLVCERQRVQLFTYDSSDCSQEVLGEFEVVRGITIDCQRVASDITRLVNEHVNNDTPVTLATTSAYSQKTISVIIAYLESALFSVARHQCVQEGGQQGFNETLRLRTQEISVSWYQRKWMNIVRSR